MRIPGKKYNCETLAEGKAYMDFTTSFMCKVMYDTHTTPVHSQMMADVRTMYQMFLIKFLTLRKMLDGITFQAEELHLKNTIDFSTAFCLVRELFESLCIFELIYIIPDTEDKKQFLHTLFTIAGLNERQHFVITTDKAKQKKEDEKKEMDRLIANIRSTELYKGLDRSSLQTVDNAIANSKYRYMFQSDGNLKFCQYEEMDDLLNIRNGAFKSMYKFLSQHEHPSSISVRQFEIAFHPENQEYKNLAKTAAMYALSMASMYIADYCKIFPEAESIFKKLPIEDRAEIDFYNRMLRGKKYSLVNEL